MSLPPDISADLWREVAWHAALEPTLDALCRVLSPLPSAPRGITLATLNLARQAVLPLGGGGAAPGLREVLLPGAAFSTLAAWSARSVFAPSTAPQFAALGLDPGLWVGGLQGSEGPLGLALVAAPAAPAAALLEPLAVAIHNQARERELEQLRRTAEADRDAALTRLGRARLDDVIVGAAGGMREVLERVDLVAPATVSVLLLGETGSGKEVVARAIHQRSPRHAAAFHRVNCGAIPAELIDSELFGHERGGFTGAVSARKGWFERADGGTLFLDEIGELSPAAQVRLLRVLQDGVIERVGGHDVRHVDVRIIAATHRDLRRMVHDGRFREDLWYRIATFPIEIPPLRDRVEDVPALARHFAERAAHRFGLPVRIPTPDEQRLLAAYAWPGNVRELAAVIDRASILGRGERLDIATALGVASPAPRTARAAPAVPDGVGADSLADAMRSHIEQALIACRGRIEGQRGAAARLNINPHTLRARMRRLGIDWDRFRD